MNSYALLAQAGDAGPVQQIAQTFGVDWPHLVAQMISFGVVCFILYKFAYRRVLTTLEQRRQQIAEGLANAEKIKAELASTEAQRQAVLVEASQKAGQLIEEARAAAARVQQQETGKAIASAEQIVAKAHEAAERDRARMLMELKRELGHLVVQTTATVAGKVLTDADQRRLSEETAKLVAA